MRSAMLSRRSLLASAAALSVGCGRATPPVREPVQVNVAAYIGFVTIHLWGTCYEGAYEAVAAELERDTDSPYGPSRGRYRLALKFTKEYFPATDRHTPSDVALDRVAALLEDLDADLVTVWPELAQWLGQRGLLLPLNRLSGVDDTTLAREFFPVALDRYRKDGALYALPVSAAPQMLYYDERHFRERGVPPVDATWDWDDLVNNAAKLTTYKQNGAVERWGLLAHDDDIWWALWQNGGEAVDPNTLSCRLQEPAAVDALQFVRDLLYKHRVSPPAAGMELWEKFGNISPAMHFRHSHSYAGPAQYRMAALPRGKIAAVPVKDGFGIGIATRTPHTEAAFTALQGFLSAWQDQVRMPARREAVSGRRVHPSLLPDDLTAIERSLEHGRSPPSDTLHRVALAVAVQSIAQGDDVAGAVNKGCAAIEHYRQTQASLPSFPLWPEIRASCEGAR